MKRILSVIFFCFITFTHQGWAAAAAPDIKADSYLLVDFHSGVQLAEKNPDKRIEPASITKLMTAYVIYQELEKGSISLEDKVLISEKAWKMEGSRMFVEAGKKVPLNRMIKGLIVQSGNDAAIALAEHISGNETAFVAKMNQTAKDMGLNSTHFSNPTGWPDPDHYTTARDIVTLTRHVIREYPEQYKLHSLKEYSYNGIKQYNRNKLLWRDPTVDGVKTGHTESAGYCLVASAARNDMRLISVILGAENEKARADYSQELLEFGFRLYETHKLYDKGSVLADARVWKGNKSTVPAGIMEDFYVTVEKGHYNQLKGLMELDGSLDAPIKRGDVVGTAIIKDGDTIVNQVPLLALDAVDPGGFWSKVTDSVKKLFN
ncbi:D-alanyl-D-alanine carboxypeptidase family protein [Cocleimonas flava]|uniref:serine-type D-Ala-D-Ala carboxypeptidase n=1 Tax=Cocleimonas flava TaxID=634765 RepID=A0A4R1ERZ5_9GAMM|nr:MULTISPECIES: D-alanyl-D-alanine carboxypeptidase family protein [Cocleimonas]MEB8432844.1 D-alanyl-D-alanine carboxypeptidase [Cocleimonas sp. KMM 6892]MEC4715703.1 D-alanyl-D-alanine carboxypeptidase [Cocleimonas sp. KMM 6895]MEC4744679.1 D-alanyl-D-alanine carboxypeptidase [Cocleimonas sp. KMM 6896]TCJ83270.1 penicillin-binding protein 6 [Cocleimonas flava]